MFLKSNNGISKNDNDCEQHLDQPVTLLSIKDFQLSINRPQ